MDIESYQASLQINFSKSATEAHVTKELLANPQEYTLCYKQLYLKAKAKMWKFCWYHSNNKSHRVAYTLKH